jgi:hypothetical protein
VDCDLADVNDLLAHIETDNVDLALNVWGVEVVMDEITAFYDLQVSADEFFTDVVHDF